MASIIRVDDLQDSGGNSIVSSDGSGTFSNNLGVANTPAFRVTLSGDQSISSTTATKVTWDTESFDTDNAFTSNKFTVPTGEGGKYFFFHKVLYDDVDDGEYEQLRLYKNGSEQNIFRSQRYGSKSASNMFMQASAVLNLSATDYIETYVYANAAGDLNSLYCTLTGYKLIGV